MLHVPWSFAYRLDRPGTTTVLDDQLQLQRLGSCTPSSSCLSLGSARIIDAGSTGHVSWGRWTDGAARFQRMLRELDQVLQANDGIHYLVGAPTLTMPTSGQARYRLEGATSPTFSLGQQAPGSFSGQGLVAFGPGTGTRIAIAAELKFGTGQHYRMVSEGAQFDASNRLSGIGNSNLQMTGSNTFRGELSVGSLGSDDAMKCGGGDCRASLDGAFFGEQASHMGFSYSVHNPAHAVQTDTINGVAVMKRE